MLNFCRNIKETTIELRPMSLVENDSNLIKIPTGTEYDAYFSTKTGLLIKLASEDEVIPSSIQMVKYGTVDKGQQSGAYLFMPDGPAINVSSTWPSVWIRVERGGPLRSRVCVEMTCVLHCVEIFPTINKARGLKLPSMSVRNLADLRNLVNYELAMLVKTGVNSQDTLYTDLNGFQYSKRKRRAKLTLQGNVYPMTTGAFIQDSSLRFSLLTAQALGVASLHSSEIQVFLDRRLNQDDQRGIGMAMNENVPVSSRFLLLFEQVNQQLDSVSSGVPSLLSTWISNDLLYPIVKLVLKQDNVSILGRRKFSLKKYPCDLHLLNLRTMESRSEDSTKKEVGLILHRPHFGYGSSESFIKLPHYIKNSECGGQEYSLGDFFCFLDEETQKNFVIKNTLLNMASNYSVKLISKSDRVLDRIQPMQIEAFRISY